MKTGISLITMGCGNVVVLKKTLESFRHVCDEVVYGDLLLFPEDREALKSYQEEFNIKILEYPFNLLFVEGFSVVLNSLAFFSSNDTVVYSNTSEIIEKDNGILDAISQDYNCYFFDHATDPHRWYRMYNRHELHWSGRIHESLVGDHRPYHKPVYRMADLEKDMQNPFKAKIFNDVKEIVYFSNYMSIVDNPNQLGGTDPGWIKFATDNYESMKGRLLKKGRRYEAFLEGDFKKYMMDAYSNPEFEKERFESSNLIEYQGDPKFLNK